VKGKVGNNNYDTGPYRCLAANKFGSVFLEKEIKIRVLGAFKANSVEKKAATQLNPTVNKNFKISCPPHSFKDGYGLSYEWGYLPTGKDTPIYYRPGNPNPRIFINYENGDLWYSYVDKDDIKQSRDIGGLRCILVNSRYKVLSNQQVLYNEYDSKLIFHKCDILSSKHVSNTGLYIKR